MYILFIMQIIIIMANLQHDTDTALSILHSWTLVEDIEHWNSVR